jgi:hypothetical protein
MKIFWVNLLWKRPDRTLQNRCYQKFSNALIFIKMMDENAMMVKGA